MSISKSVKSVLLTGVGALVLTTMAASFQPADAGPILRGRIGGALAGAALGLLVGDPAGGARLGRAVGTVKGIGERRDRRRKRLSRR
jgi:hypothetical protein